MRYVLSKRRLSADGRALAVDTSLDNQGTGDVFRVHALNEASYKEQVLVQELFGVARRVVSAAQRRGYATLKPS